MRSLVLYASRFGNTRQVAEAIGRRLREYGPVDVLAVDDVEPAQLHTADLLVIGGPTEAGAATPAIVRFFHRFPHALGGVAAAAFDTRADMPRWLTGSAAMRIERRLREGGATVVAEAASFVVAGRANVKTGEGPSLLDGELDRASTWGASLAARIPAAKSA